MEAAAMFLAVRSRSVAETRRRLLHLGYAEAVAEAALARLGGLGYLDDSAFARAWVESRDRSRPRGETALRQELRRKGIDEALVREVLDERGAAAHGPMPSEAPWGATASRHEDEGDPEASADRQAARRLLERKRSSLAREPDPRKRRQKAYALLARNGFDPTVCRDESAVVLAPAAGGHPDASRDPDSEA